MYISSPLDFGSTPMLLHRPRVARHTYSSESIALSLSRCSLEPGFILQMLPRGLDEPSAIKRGLALLTGIRGVSCIGLHPVNFRAVSNGVSGIPELSYVTWLSWH